MSRLKEKLARMKENDQVANKTDPVAENTSEPSELVLSLKEKMRKISDRYSSKIDSSLTRRTVDQLITLYDACGKRDSAAKWRRIGLDLPPASPRLPLVDDAGVEIGVDRHLLARHGIQGESRRDLRDTPRALRDNDEIDDDEDKENQSKRTEKRMQYGI